MKPGSRSQTARTSVTDPLHIAELSVGDGPVRVGVTFCPGKQGGSGYGAPWRRDLKADLDAIKAWGADVVVTLVEDHELTMLGVPDLGDQVKRRGMVWLHLPIQDVRAPGPDFDAAWPAIATQLRKYLIEGGRVLVHCRGGLGRAGTVAACLLVEMGARPADAIRDVRRVRRGAIETSAQEKYVLMFKPSSRSPAEA